jgi:acylphosphatase
MANYRAHVIISGIVQGVFFRQKTKQQAESQGVTGWVRNLPDGKVEAVFEGEEGAVKTLIEYCHHGPSLAYVTNVDVEWQSYKGEFSGFKTR